MATQGHESAKASVRSTQELGYVARSSFSVVILGADKWPIRPTARWSTLNTTRGLPSTGRNRPTSSPFRKTRRAMLQHSIAAGWGRGRLAHYMAHTCFMEGKHWQLADSRKDGRRPSGGPFGSQPS